MLLTVLEKLKRQNDFIYMSYGTELEDTNHMNGRLLESNSIFNL